MRETIVPKSSMQADDVGIDIDALLYGAGPLPEPVIDNDIAIMLDRQIAREIAKQTGVTTLVIVGNLCGPRCMPTQCEDMGASFKLISMRKIDGSLIATFSVPVEGEMAELFEHLDGRRGIKAVAYDQHGRPKEAYIL